MARRTRGCKGYTQGTQILRIVGSAPAVSGFGLDPLEVGMFCLYRSGSVPGSALPIRLGKVLRIALEVQASPFVVVQAWWPILKPEKYGDKLNLFGTWIPGPEPVVDNAPPPRKRAARQLPDFLLVDMADVLVWPVALDMASSNHAGGGRIPFAALHHVHSVHNINVATPALSFSDRGKSFYVEVVKRVALQVHRQGGP